MKREVLLALVLVVLSALTLVLVAKATAKERPAPEQPKVVLPSWQFVGLPAKCTDVGDHMVLQLNNGTDFITVARLKVIHIDRQTDTVTFAERQP